MKATSIDKTEVLSLPTTNCGNPIPGTGKPESALRAAARRHGLTLKQLAARMGVSYGYLSSVSAGRRPWSPMLRERVAAVLGEVPGTGVVYRQGGLVKGESSYIRERAREMGMGMKGLAKYAGLSPSYMTQVSRGQRNMSPAVQARVEARWMLRPGLNPPTSLESIAGRCGTGWMPTGSARTRSHGWPASAPVISPRS